MDEFRFKMEGPIFERGIPLHIALASLQDVQAIFDKTYLGLTGGKRVSKREREQFQLRTFDIKNGSLESDLHIYLEQAQYAFPVIASLQASDIWEYTKQAFQFLRHVYGSAQQGQSTMYEANDDGTVNVYNGDNLTVYNGPVITIGREAAPHWRSLNHKMKEGKVNGYNIGSADNPEISLTSNDRGIFDVPSHIDQASVKLTCDIYDFNKRENIGKLAVGDGEAIPVGDYRFQVLGSQDRVDYIASMARSAVNVTVLREVRIDPVGETTIVRLHVMEVNP